MTREDDFRAMTYQILDGGNSSTDPCVISYVEVIIQWNVQIDSNKHFLSLQISFLLVPNAILCSHGSSTSSTTTKRINNATPEERTREPICKINKKMGVFKVRVLTKMREADISRQ
ncbi:hypothetical protein ES332_A02G146400v1 [Gossypium tomentosum]|uniref:Uncharacterized protein n=1 Tax=Gossypium tomentosum TaxID=34277 RepID=A0A5D2RI45_GOSTO|nr:hypothetical protein ES332_A02G146400v1 [Gossypium tomentosum]